MTKGHWSDCAIYNAPAFEPGPCDCGGLDLATYDRYVAVTSLVPTPGSLAEFVCNGEMPSLVETHQLPTSVLATDTPPTDLPNAHDRLVSRTGSDSVDFDNTGKAVIGDRKALTSLQRITSNVPPHSANSDSLGAEPSIKKSGDTNA